MDIQPVGTMKDIAYYVAKYVAKEEPQHIKILYKLKNPLKLKNPQGSSIF
jgi:hypothetical protein